MGLFTPVWMKEDLEGKKLLKAKQTVESMTGQEDLRKVVLQAHHSQVAFIAVQRIEDTAFLARVALGQEPVVNESVLAACARRLNDPAVLTQIAQTSPSKPARMAVLERIDDPIVLLKIAESVKDNKERDCAVQALKKSIKLCRNDEILLKLALSGNWLEKYNIPELAAGRITGQKALAEAAFSAAGSKARCAAIKKIDDVKTLEKIALENSENGWLAVRQLDPDPKRKDAGLRTEALSRIAVEAPAAEVRTEAVKSLFNRGQAEELRMKIVLNDPDVCEKAAGTLRNGKAARTVLVDMVGGGRLATDASLTAKQKNALENALVTVAGYLRSGEDAGLALDTLEKLDPECFCRAANAVREKRSELEILLRRFRCTRCGQPVIFAVEAGPSPRGTFTCGCTDGPDGAFWEEIVADDPDWGIPENDYVWVCEECHGLASDMISHKLPSRGRCNCGARPKTQVHGLICSVYSWTDRPEKAVRVGVVEMKSDAIKKLPPMKEGGVRRIDEAEKVQVLVCPKCGRPATYYEEFESIDSYKIQHGFYCEHGCGVTADEKEVFEKFKIVQRHPDSVTGSVACLCRGCGKMIKCDTLQHGHTYADSCSRIRCSVKDGTAWREPQYLGFCTHMYPSSYVVVRTRIDY